jgi:UrcA family protein
MKGRTLKSASVTMCFAVMSVAAQTTPEVVVTSPRMVTTQTGQRPGGTPIMTASLSYTVSAQGFDLTTQEGKASLERAVRDAAWRACSEIHKQFAGATPPQSECVQQATANAMNQVRALEAAAGKGTGGK